MIFFEAKKKPCHNNKILISSREIKLVEQFIYYLLVGLGSNFVAFCVYLLITSLGSGPKVAMTLVYVVGVVIGFLGNLKWTFKYTVNNANMIIRFLITHLVGYFLNFLLLFIFVDKFGYDHKKVQASAIVLVACFVFLLMKNFVFTKKA